MIFRYPGGKNKFRKDFIQKIRRYYNDKQFYDSYYVELFFGSGSIGLDLLNRGDIKKVCLNDKDRAIASIWNAVIHKPNDLCEKISQFTPNLNSFYEFKENLLKDNFDDLLDMAFQKIALHQMSYSGLGTKAGGPIGGKSQQSDYKIDCRWNSSFLNKNIKKYHNFLSRIDLFKNNCLNKDFQEVFEEIDEHDCFFYLDPPYYVKGSELYQYGFEEEDHIRLSNSLQNTQNPWILSYDNCEEIKQLYKWAYIYEINMKCTINGVNKKTELIIVPEKCKYLNEVTEYEIF